MKLAPILPTSAERERLADRLRHLADRALKFRGGCAEYRRYLPYGATLHLAALIEHCDRYYDELDIGHEPGVRLSAPSRFDGSAVGSSAASCAEIGGAP